MTDETRRPDGSDGTETATETDQYRTVRVDTHLHTAASYDAETTPEELLATARESGLDAVVVTDHDTTEGARVTANLADADDPLVVSGCEVSTADGHLLAIGVEEAPEPGRPLAATARTVRSTGGLAVVPHPFQRSRHGASADAIDDVDGIEVYNAHALTGTRNAQAEQFAAAESYPAYGGSDAHTPETIGRAATEVRLPRGTPLTESSLLSALRAGRTEAVGDRIPLRRLLGRFVTNATIKTRTLL